MKTKRWHAAFLSTALMMAGGSGAWANPPQAIALTDQDVSRGYLSEYALSQSPDVSDRGVVTQFRFPTDANDGIYGVDVSHHNGQVPWSRLVAEGARFAYVKATQGASYYDSRFAENWAETENIRRTHPRFRRGAYHFLSANDSAEEQIQNYEDTVGRLSSADLPPVLDMEWDVLIRDGKVVTDVNGNPIDQWDGQTSAQISAKALKWLAETEKRTGRRPIIYTAAAWWNPKIGRNPAFAGYTIWIADYRKSAIANGAPAVPGGLRESIWQFTSHGSVSLSPTKSFSVDVNRVSGGEASFSAVFGPT